MALNYDLAEDQQILRDSVRKFAEGEIKLLARICRLVRHPGFMEELRSAPDGDSVVEVIERVDKLHV